MWEAVNKAGRSRNEAKVETLGPLAILLQQSMLSVEDQLVVYRGAKTTGRHELDNYESWIGSKVNLNGYCCAFTNIKQAKKNANNVIFELTINGGFFQVNSS